MGRRGEMLGEGWHSQIFRFLHRSPHLPVPASPRLSLSASCLLQPGHDDTDGQAPMTDLPDAHGR